MSRILVVEDESIVGLDMQSRLQRLGHDVPAVASTGAQALELAAGIQPDLVLMDIMLPGEMDGVEAADLIRQRHSVPVVFLTACADEKTLEQVKIAGHFGFILKPFVERELLSTIEAVLRRHQGELGRQNAPGELEHRVGEHTAELSRLNDDLIAQARGRERAAADLQVRYEQGQVLYRLSDGLARAETTETMFQEALDALGALNYDRASIRLVERGKLVFKAWRELSERFRQSLSRTPSWPAAAGKSEPVLIHDVGLADAGLREAAAAAGLGSAAFLPLCYAGTVYGEVGVYGEWPHPFEAEEMQLLQSVANHVEFAIGRKMALDEKSELESQRRNSQKMDALGQLAGSIAHDFNNVLTVITGYTELVSEAIGKDDPLYDDIRAINDAGERGAMLTGRLLTFARRQAFNYQPLVLNQVVNEMEELLQSLIGEDIQLSTRLDQNLGYTETETGQVEQIITNLVLNARDAMPDGGRLVISTESVELDEAYCRRRVNVSPGPFVLMKVADNGAGMSAEVLGRIFEPYFSTKSHQKSSGMGLSTVYGLVYQSGGHIEVESNPGAGTTCSIYLPQVKAPNGDDYRAREETPNHDENHPAVGAERTASAS